MRAGRFWGILKAARLKLCINSGGPDLIVLFKWMTALAAVFGGMCLLRSKYERDQLVTEYFEIHSPKIKGENKRIVFLSDLHDKEFGTGNERLLEAIRGAKPDAVLIGGDMMVAKGIGDLDVSLSFLEKLTKEFLVFYANGNHEMRLRDEKETYGEKYLVYRKKMWQLGVIFLPDTHVGLSDDINLYGLELKADYYDPGYPKMDPGYMDQVFAKPDAGKFNILLAHSPMFFREYEAWGADLTLSGHFHGGTIRIPGLGGLMTPQYQFFFPWCAGLFEGKRGSKLLVSRGLGTHSINIRLNNKPQVVVVDILK